MDDDIPYFDPDRAARRRVEATLADDDFLPPGQPSTLAAFADPATVVTSLRAFGEVECLVSFQHLGPAMHFCLAHRWGGLAPRSNEAFRAAATALLRQAATFAHPEATVLFAGGAHRLAEHRPIIRAVNAIAAACRFYRHLLPQRQLREQFSRVEMTWDGAQLVDPDWSAEIYPTLPAALRQAADHFTGFAPPPPP